VRLPWWAIVAQMSSGRQRFLAYVSARRNAAASTHNVQPKQPQLRDAPGRTGRYARTEMKDPDAALAGWVSRAPLCLRALSLRRDLALPLVVLAVQLTWTAVGGWKLQVFSQPRPPGAVDWVLLVVGPVALVARRRHPLAVLWVSLAATFASPWLAHASFVVAFFVAAIRGKRYPAWMALAIGFAWTIWLAPLIYRRPIPPVNDALLLAGWTVALAIAAEATRIRAERVAATRATHQVEQRRQQSEERLRVARDLHDVIGHNISLINVQASMGLDLMDSQPEQGRAALSAIKSASKEALEELRTMLTTLRQDDDAPRSPAPRLDRLPELIELTRAAGLSVEIEVTGKPPHLPAAVHLAAYRIIQESLTNVARHAGRARVTVRVTYCDAGVHVEIDDDGPTNSRGTGVIGTGSGITGMRERATALGGELSAGFRQGGGFRVSARLPARQAP
jgi:signal transduction histidine kinase